MHDCAGPDKAGHDFSKDTLFFRCWLCGNTGRLYPTFHESSLFRYCVCSHGEAARREDRKTIRANIAKANKETTR